MGAHLIDGEFQSDKYPTTPRGKVPLSVKDKSAQDLLWNYAQRRRVIDAEFSDDLEQALRLAGYDPMKPQGDWFWDDRDSSATCDSAHELVTQNGPGEVAEIHGAESVWQGAGLYLEAAFDADNDDYRYIWATTTDEAHGAGCATLLADFARWLVA